MVKCTVSQKAVTRREKRIYKSSIGIPGNDTAELLLLHVTEAVKGTRLRKAPGPELVKMLYKMFSRRYPGRMDDHVEVGETGLKRLWKQDT